MLIERFKESLESSVSMWSLANVAFDKRMSNISRLNDCCRGIFVWLSVNPGVPFLFSSLFRFLIFCFRSSVLVVVIPFFFCCCASRCKRYGLGQTQFWADHFTWHELLCMTLVVRLIRMPVSLDLYGTAKTRNLFFMLQRTKGRWSVLEDVPNDGSTGTIWAQLLRTLSLYALFFCVYAASKGPTMRWVRSICWMLSLLRKLIRPSRRFVLFVLKDIFDQLLRLLIARVGQRSYSVSSECKLSSDYQGLYLSERQELSHFASSAFQGLYFYPSSVSRGRTLSHLVGQDAGCFLFIFQSWALCTLLSFLNMGCSVLGENSADQFCVFCKGSWWGRQYRPYRRRSSTDSAAGWVLVPFPNEALKISREIMFFALLRWSDYDVVYGCVAFTCFKEVF